MKTIGLFAIGLFFVSTGFSQESDKKEIEALKIAFITNALDMDKSTAQKFWPVYNKYEKQEDILRSDMRCTVYDQLDKLGPMSAADSEELLQDYMQLRDREHKFRKEYVSELKKVISAKEILQLKKAEYDFHKKLLNEYRSGGKNKKK